MTSGEVLVKSCTSVYGNEDTNTRLMNSTADLYPEHLSFMLCYPPVWDASLGHVWNENQQPAHCFSCLEWDIQTFVSSSATSQLINA